MSEITLNIYSAKKKGEIEKTHTADGYDLMLGTVDDFMEIIDIDKLDNEMEIAKMIAKGYGQLKPLLKDVFPDLTDDELRRAKVKDLVATIIQIGLAVAESLKAFKSEKNVTGA